MLRLFLFSAGTLFFLRISWKSLKNPQSHGFYRFFVFEGILLLLLLNQPFWFVRSFAPLQLLSWFLLSVSILLIIQSKKMLKTKGGIADRREMPENFVFENTVNVVEEGVYRYIRHPMYSSLLFLGWGAFFKQITLLNIFLISLVSILIFILAKVEERENIRFFGATYERYMKRSRMFVPLLF